MASSSSYVALGAPNWITSWATRLLLTLGSGPRECTGTKRQEKQSGKNSERRMSGSGVSGDLEDQTRAPHSFGTASADYGIDPPCGLGGSTGGAGGE